VFLFAIGVLTFAMTSSSTIYGMVENAYKITLVAAFTPLAFGLYWKRAEGRLAWNPAAPERRPLRRKVICHS
jgi:Na+/proline symporter